MNVLYDNEVDALYSEPQSSAENPDHTRIEIRAFITLPSHGRGIQAGGVQPL